MNYEEAVLIWRSIQDSTLADLRDDLVTLAVRYARVRVDYLLSTPREQISRSEGARRAIMPSSPVAMFLPAICQKSGKTPTGAGKWAMIAK